MRIIFIRHAEPDYEKNSLTKKGFREAEILSHRVKNWNVTAFYCSPYGRAKDTAAPSMKLLQRTYTELDWLHEINAPIDHPENAGEKSIPWDFYPTYLNDHPALFDANNWQNTPVMQTGDVAHAVAYAYEGMDQLLASYGYLRNGLFYRAPKDHIATNHYMNYNDTTIESMKMNRSDDTTIVCFCHLGSMFSIISHLINVSPVALWQGAFVPPASITVVSSEERRPGEAYFRCQVLGDAAHLREAGEPISYYGAFSAPFQG